MSESKNLPQGKIIDKEYVKNVYVQCCLKCTMNKMHYNTTQVDHIALFIFTKLLKGWHREMLSLTSSCLEMHLLYISTGFSMVLQRS